MPLIELPHEINKFFNIVDVTEIFDFDNYIMDDSADEIINQFLNSIIYKDELDKYKIVHNNSMLIYGQPGCGKNMLSKYISYKANLPFAYINCSNLISDSLGGTIKNISTIFEYLSTIECVLVLDDLDAIGTSRDSENIGNLSKVVIALNYYLKNINNNKIVIGTTSRKDLLDKGLISSFGLKYKVLLPKRETRKALIKKQLSFADILINNNDMENLLDYTLGYSYVEVICLINNQIIKSLAHNKKADFKDIIDLHINEYK